MKNAHERFGWLEFEKQLKDTRTRLRVALDRFISEPVENKEASGTCHLVSVFGNDVDIGADMVPCRDEIEQRIQQVLPALLRIARPDDQCALPVRSCCRKFVGAFILPVQSVDQRGRHLRIEFEIEVAHGEPSVL